MTAEGARWRLGLRGRLVAFFIVITVVPLTVAVTALQLQIDTQLRARTEHELATVRSATAALTASEQARAGDLADDLAGRIGQAFAQGELPPELDDPEAVEAWLAANVEGAVPGRADVVAVVADDGEALATILRDPATVTAVDPVGQIVATAQERVPPDSALLEVRELRGTVDEVEELLGWLVTGVWTDAELLERLGIVGGAALTTNGEVLAARGATPAEVPLGDETATVTTGQVGDTAVVVSRAPLVAPDGAQAPIELVLWTPQASRLGTLALGLLVLVPSMALAGGLGWLLASAVVAPVRRAADAARAVAAGDLSRTLEPSGGPELEDLADALNRMSADLARRLAELSRTSDQLRGSLERLGTTLSSSLDLNRMLAVVVETAQETLGADRAMLLLITPERDALYCKVARGVVDMPPALALDEGLLGHVARTAAPLLLPHDAATVPAPHPREPRGASQLAVPLLGRGRVVGVLTLLREDPLRPFSRSDLDTIRSFSAQASVAIENVLLHQEARRLSVTDSLTGLWNFRYFQLQADREIESATRFERPLGLVVVDIDRFKAVNDRHGHQVGDVVLATVARRMREATRTPDVVARYGGEEFVVLLPGADLEGALASAERIRRAVADEPVDVRSAPLAVSGLDDGEPVRELRITCSAGAAAFPLHGRSVPELLRSADAAMYRAKQLGRDRVMAADHRDDAGAPPPEVS